jgi:hypothetical protein
MTYSHFSPGEIRLSNHNQQEKKWSPNLGEKDIKYNADNNKPKGLKQLKSSKVTTYMSEGD